MQSQLFFKPMLSRIYRICIYRLFLKIEIFYIFERFKNILIFSAPINKILTFDKNRMFQLKFTKLCKHCLRLKSQRLAKIYFFYRKALADLSSHKMENLIHSNFALSPDANLPTI